MGLQPGLSPLPLLLVIHTDLIGISYTGMFPLLPDSDRVPCSSVRAQVEQTFFFCLTQYFKGLSYFQALRSILILLAVLSPLGHIALSLQWE